MNDGAVAVEQGEPVLSGEDDRVVDSFEAWYDLHWPRLVQFALGNLRSLSEAEDVASDTCVKLLRRWDTRRPSDPTRWAFTVTANAVRRQARHRSRTVAESGAARIGLVQAIDVDLLDAIRKLPSRQRLAVSLHYLADLPQAEVAQTMNVAASTVGVLLKQARATLRVLMEEQ